MASKDIPDAVRRVFTDTFSARDIAEPLASFDGKTPCNEVCSFMRANDFDVIGIRSEGQIVGYAERGWLKGGPCEEWSQPFDRITVFDDSTRLLSVLLKLNQIRFGFVNMLGRVGGIVTRADLQKPPVRMWLFGLVTLIEMRFTELIEGHYSTDDWMPLVSDVRLEKARTLLDERRRRNQELRLFDCLQFSDKGQIVARNEAIRTLTIFSSRRKAEEAVKKVERLRNNLAHAQDILAADWDTIVELCEFVVRQ